MSASPSSMASAASPDWQELMAGLAAGQSLTPQELAVLSQTPATNAPTGVTPNLVNPASNKEPQLVVTSMLLVFMCLFIINRVYVKTFLMKKCSWDDATLLLALMGTIAYYVAAVWGVQKGGMGIHLWNMSILQAISHDFLIPAYLLIVLSPLTLLFLKITFFILYLQLFGQLDWLRICSWIGLCLTTCTYIAFTVAQFYFATPQSGETWMTHNQSRSSSLAVPVSAMGLVIDLIILLLPVIGISGLHISTKKKLGAMLVFFSGLMACICSAISIYYRHQLIHTTDVSWAIVPVNTATLCEMMIGVICACMPSVAYSYRHGPTGQIVRKTLSSRFTSFRSTLTGSQRSTNATSEEASEASFRHIGPISKQSALYINMDDYSASTVGINAQTHIVSVGKDGRNEDEHTGPGIYRHYQFDVERDSMMRSSADRSSMRS